MAKICVQCGAENADHSIYCVKCGHALTNVISQTLNNQQKQNAIVKRVLSAALISAIVLCVISAGLYFATSLPEIYTRSISVYTYGGIDTLEEYLMIESPRDPITIQVGWEDRCPPRFSQELSKEEIIPLCFSGVYFVLSGILLMSFLVLRGNLKWGKRIARIAGLFGIIVMITEFILEYCVWKYDFSMTPEYQLYKRGFPHITYFVLIPLMVFIPFLAWNLQTKKQDNT